MSEIFEILRVFLMTIGGLLLSSLMYGPFISSFAFLLYLAHVPKHSTLFSGFALFGILAGFLVACLSFKNSPEGPFMENIPVVVIGERISEYAYSHFGPAYPLPFRSVPSVLWILGKPQIFLFTSAVFWSFCGIIAQLIFNKVKGLPLFPRDKATLLTVLGLTVSLIVTACLLFLIEYVRAYH